jgi:hypothetical protein
MRRVRRGTGDVKVEERQTASVAANAAKARIKIPRLALPEIESNFVPPVLSGKNSIQFPGLD